MKLPSTQSIVGIVAICAAMTVVGLLFFIKVPDGNRDIINTAIGMIVGSGFVSVVGYYFGSSKGSTDKTKLIDKVINDGNEKSESIK